MKKMIKKILGVLMATVLSAASMVVSMPLHAFAAEAPQLPSINKFASPDDLKNANNFTLHSGNGSGSAQKVNFGNGKIWYIAGTDSDGSLILMCDPTNPLTGMVFHSGGSTIYSDSDVISYLRGTALSNFTSQEQDLMKNPSLNTPGSAPTSDKLYLGSGENYANEMTVGMNNTKIGLYGNGTSGSTYATESTGEFWLRNPTYEWMGDWVNLVYPGEEYAVKNYGVGNSFNVVPAFDLDMSRVLFASTATVANDSPSLLSGEMKLRIANDGKFTSTAAVNGQTISVTNNDGESDVYLYVQGNDGSDWVVSKKVTSTAVYTLADLGRSGSDDLSKCQVWLEKNIPAERLTYATYAAGGNNKGNSGNGNDGSRSGDDSCGHDFVWETVSAATETSYGTEGYICTKCGATQGVRSKSPLAEWARMMINNAKPGDELKLDFGPWHSFPLWMMQMIAEKPDVTYVLKYTYQGKMYEATIKRGEKFELDCEWYGPLKTAELFDTKITEQ